MSNDKKKEKHSETWWAVKCEQGGYLCIALSKTYAAQEMQAYKDNPHNDRRTFDLVQVKVTDL
jgi:hypothetical protein